MGVRGVARDGSDAGPCLCKRIVRVTQKVEPCVADAARLGAGEVILRVTHCKIARPNAIWMVRVVNKRSASDNG